MSAFRALVLFAILTPLASSPQDQPAELPLRVRESVPLSVQGGKLVMHPARCDVRGRLYVRFTDPGGGGALSSPVTRIGRDGKVEVVFGLDDVPDFEPGSTFDDFGVDSRGRVYLLATRVIQKSRPEEPESKGPEIEQLVVAFDSDGKYSSTIKLDALFKPYQLAVFPSGELLASGQRMVRRGDQLEPLGRAFTAIFDQRGSPITEVSAANDVEEDTEEDPASAAPPGSESHASTRSESQRLETPAFEQALQLGVAVPSADGNIYLMRATREPLVFVVARDGSVVRRMIIPAPAEHGRPVTMQVAAGKIVVMFVETEANRAFKRHVLVVANSETGEILAHYVGAREIGGALACYTGDGFTFLAGQQGKFVIQRTYPY